MSIKTVVMAAAIAVAAVVASPADVRAGPRIDFFFDINPYRYEYSDRYYYGDRYHNGDRYYYDDRVSCRQARRILRRHYGYSNIRTIDCRGDSFKFNAWRHGRKYRVKLNAWTGQVTSARRLR